jgi:predicted membrane protein
MSNQQQKHGSHTWLAFVLIGVGLLFLIDNLGFIEIDNFWRLWPVILIVIGIGKIKTADPRERSTGTILLTIGGVFLLVNFGVLPWDLIWRLWPVALILIGISFLLRRRRTSDAETDTYSEDTLDAVAIFGGSERKINSGNFQGGHVTAIFGGVELDFSNARLAPGNNTIDIFTMFGGTEIRVPLDWNVQMKGMPIFGGFEDSRASPVNVQEGEISVKDRTLTIKGLVLFGGIEIKSA